MSHTSQPTRTTTSQPAARPSRMYAPDVDIRETDEAIVIVADMAGVEPGRVNVTMDNDQLVLEGVGAVPGLESHRLIHAEFNTGDYKRTFTVSDEIDREHIVAHMKNGVLRLTLPKAREARVRKIQVHAA